MFCIKKPLTKEWNKWNMGTDLVQASTNVNGRGLNGAIDNLRKWRQKVGRVDFGIEEYFRGEEALVPNVH